MQELKPSKLIKPESIYDSKTVDMLPRTSKQLLLEIYNVRFSGGCGSVHFISQDELFHLTKEEIYAYNRVDFSKALSQLISLKIIQSEINGNLLFISESYLNDVKNITIPELEAEFRPTTARILVRLRDYVKDLKIKLHYRIKDFK
jgi:hypothetical protein